MRACKYFLVVTAGALALSSAAQSKIVLNKSIHGVKLGMTKKQVARILGPGKPTKRYAFFRGTQYRHGLYVVSFSKGRALQITTRDPRERTPQGLGVGSKKSQVKRRLRHAWCGIEGRIGTVCVTRQGGTTFLFDRSGETKVGAVWVSG
jgi:hypothetical protein